MAEFLDIYIREKGSDVVKRNLDGIIDSAQRATSSLRVMQNALFVLGGAGTLSALGELIDTTTNFENRLQLVTKSQKEFNYVQKEVYAIAARTRSNFEATAQTYTRTALAVRGLGISQKETLLFTELLNKAVILSGTNAKESGAALLQLSQGLASGRLQGDELRSVLEQIPLLADLIGKELVKVGEISSAELNKAGDPVDKVTKALFNTRKELRDLGKNGKIGTDIVFNAVINGQDILDPAFARTVSTIGQAFEKLRTRFIEFLDGVEDAYGPAEAFSSVIIELADNLDSLTAGILSFGAAFTTLKFSSYINTLSSAIIKNRELREAVKSGNAVLLDSGERSKAKAKFLLEEAALVKQNISNTIAETNAKKVSILAEAELARQAKESIIISKSKRYARDAETGAFISYKNAVNQVVSSSVAQSSLQREAISLSKEITALRIAEASALASLALKQTDYDKEVDKTNTTFGKLKRALPGLAVELDSVALALRGAASWAMSNPYTALAVAIAAVGTAVYGMSNDIIVGGENSSTTLRDYFDSAFTDILKGAEDLGSSMISPFELMLSDVISILGELAGQFGITMENIKSVTKTTSSFIGETLSSTISRLVDELKNMFSSLELGYLYARKGVQSLILNTDGNSPLGTRLKRDKSGNTVGLKSEEEFKKDQDKLKANRNAIAKTNSLIDKNLTGFGERFNKSSPIDPNKNQSLLGDSDFNSTLSIKDKANLRASERKFQQEEKVKIQQQIKQTKESLKYQKELKQIQQERDLSKISDEREKFITKSIFSASGRIGTELTGQQEAQLYLRYGEIFDLQQMDKKESKSKSKEPKSSLDQPTFASALDQLKQENFLLSLNSTEREKSSQIFRIQEELKRKLTDTEASQIASIVDSNIKLEEQTSLYDSIKSPLTEYTKQLETLNAIKQKITDEEYSDQLAQVNLDFLRTQKDPSSGLKRAILEIKESRKDLATEVEQVYRDLQQPQESYAMRLRALNYLHQEAKISQKDYNDELRNSRIEYLETQDTYEAGIERGLLKLAQTSADQASLIEGVFSNAFQGINDSLADLVVDGKANFSDLVRSIQKDLIKMYTSQAFSQIAQIAGQALGAYLGAPVATGAPLNTLPSGYSGASFDAGSTASLYVNSYAEGGIAGVPVKKFSGNGGITSGGMPAVLHPNEAVVPLSRGRKIPVELGDSSGSNVKVNVYNQSGGQASTSRSRGSDGSEVIDIIIQQAKNSLTSDIFRGGTSVNRALESRYALNASAGINR